MNQAPEHQTVIALREWDELGPASGSLAGLALASDHARSIAQALSESQKLHVEEMRSGLRVSTTSYVGRVSFDGLTIDVRPKIDKLPLSILFGYAYGIRNLHLVGESLQSIDDASFIDLVVHQVNTEARELLSRGLKRAYMRECDDLQAPRGRFDLQRIATKISTSAGIPCIHYPRTHSCLANKVLISGLWISSLLAHDARLRGESQMLLSQVTDITCADRANIREVEQFIWECDRLSSAYLPVAKLTLLLLDGQGVSMADETRTESLRGFLFDMNRFFQELVSRLLHDALPEFLVIDEFRLRYMLKYAKDYNPKKRNAPTPRPDFVVSRPGNKDRIILDAKYRDIWEGNLPRDMLYQLCIYALSGISDGVSVIVYPSTNRGAVDQYIEINNPVSGEPLGKVILRAIDVLRLSEILSDEKSCMRPAMMRSVAEMLVSRNPISPIYSQTYREN